MVSGCGGQPGTKRSTGKIVSRPSVISGLPKKGPPVIVQLPTAMTTFGSGIASYVVNNAVFWIQVLLQQCHLNGGGMPQNLYQTVPDQKTGLPIHLDLLHRHYNPLLIPA